MTESRENPEAINLPRIDQFLCRGGFAVLARNSHDPNPDVPFEAWAYQGPLDFNIAAPVVFGLGVSGLDAMRSLGKLLADVEAARQMSDMATHLPLALDDRERATVLAALRYHQAENLQGTGEIPDLAIGRIASDDGRVEALGAEEVDRLCERVNLDPGASYSRLWRCSGCGRVVTWSYEDLAEGGTPYCPDCDDDMEMI